MAGLIFLKTEMKNAILLSQNGQRSNFHYRHLLPDNSAPAEPASASFDRHRNKRVYMPRRKLTEEEQVRADAIRILLQTPVGPRTVKEKAKFRFEQIQSMVETLEREKVTDRQEILLQLSNLLDRIQRLRSSECAVGLDLEIIESEFGQLLDLQPRAKMAQFIVVQQGRAAAAAAIIQLFNLRAQTTLPTPAELSRQRDNTNKLAGLQSVISESFERLRGL